MDFRYAVPIPPSITSKLCINDVLMFVPQLEDNDFRLNNPFFVFGLIILPLRSIMYSSLTFEVMMDAPLTKLSTVDSSDMIWIIIFPFSVVQHD